MRGPRVESGQLGLMPPEGIDWAAAGAVRRVWLEDVGGDHRARMEFLAGQRLRLMMADLGTTGAETLHFSNSGGGETLHLRASGDQGLLEKAERYFPAAARWMGLLHGSGDRASSGHAAIGSSACPGLLLEVEAGWVTRVTDSWRDYPQAALRGARPAQALSLLEQGERADRTFLVSALVQALEEARGMRVPAAASALRAVLLECERVGSHLRWMSGAASALGRPRTAEGCERLRRDLVSGLEGWLGDPLVSGWMVPGGMREDFPLERAAEFAAVLVEIAAKWDKVSSRLVSLPVPRWVERKLRPLCAGVERNGWVGPLARAAGLDVDARKEEPGVYAAAGWEETLLPENAGIFRRMLALRAGEAASSLRFAARVLSDLPEPPLLAKRGRGGRGEGFGRLEGPDGEVCCHVIVEKGRVGQAAFSLPLELNRSAARVLEGCRLDEIDIVSLAWRDGP